MSEEEDQREECGEDDRGVERRERSPRAISDAEE